MRFLSRFWARQFEEAFNHPLPRTLEEKVELQDSVMEFLEKVGYEAEMARVEETRYLESDPPVERESRQVWYLGILPTLLATEQKKKEYCRLRRLARLAGFPQHLIEDTGRRIKERGFDEGLIFSLF